MPPRMLFCRHGEAVHNPLLVAGNYKAKDPAEITILDVVTAVADLQRIRSCPLGLSSHTRLCPLHKKLDDAYAATEKAFREVTIAQLLRSTSKIFLSFEVLGQASGDFGEFFATSPLSMPST